MLASKSNTKNILIMVTGSIAAFKAVALVSKLKQAKAPFTYDIEVVLSNDAKHFIGAASFEGINGKLVRTELFESGKLMDHIQLERWADLILVYPATGNTISTFAHGRSDSLMGSLFLAHEFSKPFWIYPAMNQAMLAHPATQANLQTLRSYGIEVKETDSGMLACGENGAGRVAEPEAVFEAIQTYFLSSKKTSHPRSILITSGGTTEAIDPVRKLTNVSTGKTGYTLARALQDQGHSVHLIQARGSEFKTGLNSISFYESTQDLAHELEQRLQSQYFDTVIHAAAVSDYSLDQIETLQGVVLKTAAKIQESEGLVLKLKPNPKLLRSLRTWSKNPKIKVISFKLTAGDSDPKLSQYDSDYIVHNALEDINESEHRGVIYHSLTQNKDPIAKFTTKMELAHEIGKMIQSSHSEGELR